MVKYETIAKRLRELRKERGLSTEELGALVDRSGKTIEAYETGTSQPNGDMLVDLCVALDCRISDFFPEHVTRGYEYAAARFDDSEVEELARIYGSMSDVGRRQLMIYARGLAATYPKNNEHIGSETA